MLLSKKGGRSSAFFHSYLCGRNVAEWLIYMKDGNYQYAVLMTVPLGKRNGELNISINRDNVDGFLTMFTVTLPITEGVCNGDQIRFNGNMKTLINVIPYEARGTISSKEIHLIFHTERGDYTAIGQRRIAAI